MYNLTIKNIKDVIIKETSRGGRRELKETLLHLTNLLQELEDLLNKLKKPRSHTTHNYTATEVKEHNDVFENCLELVNCFTLRDIWLDAHAEAEISNLKLTLGVATKAFSNMGISAGEVNAFTQHIDKVFSEQDESFEWKVKRRKILGFIVFGLGIALLLLAFISAFLLTPASPAVLVALFAVASPFLGVMALGAGPGIAMETPDDELDERQRVNHLKCLHKSVGLFADKHRKPAATQAAISDNTIILSQSI